MSSSIRMSHDILIAPLTFLQIYRSAGIVIDSLLEADAAARYWLGNNPQLKVLARLVAAPLYYHFTTSGYSASAEGKMVGWIFVRGRYQILYIDTLVVSPSWRRKRIARLLLRFVEQQARDLHREWLGLTTTVANEQSIKLYETEGYERSHWQVFRGRLASSKCSNVYGLKRVWGMGAEQIYRRVVTLDVYAGDPWSAPAENRFLTLEPYRQRGQQWALMRDGKDIAYFNYYLEADIAQLYVACDPNWWGKADVIDAVCAILDHAKSSTETQIRLASSGHHRAMTAPLEGLGFTEMPAITMRMFKRLDETTFTPEVSAGII